VNYYKIGKPVPQHATEAWGLVSLWLHLFLISALDEGEWSPARLGRFIFDASAICITE
jgi:hypothetical protein